MRTVHFYIDPADWKEICRAAVELDVSRSQLTRFILHQWLANKQVDDIFEWGSLEALPDEERHDIRNFIKNVESFRAPYRAEEK